MSNNSSSEISPQAQYGLQQENKVQQLDQQPNLQSIQVEQIPVSQQTNANVQNIYGNQIDQQQNQQQQYFDQNQNIVQGIIMPDDVHTNSVPRNYRGDPNNPFELNDLQEGHEWQQQFQNQNLRRAQIDIIMNPFSRQQRNLVLVFPQSVQVMQQRLNENLVKLYIDGGEYRKVGNRVIYRSMIRYLPDIAKQIHAQTDISIEGIDLLNNVSFVGNEHDFIDRNIISKLEFANNYAEYERIKNTKTVKCCSGLVPLIQKYLKCLIPVTGILIIIMISLIPLPISTYQTLKNQKEDKYHPDEKETKVSNALWLIILNALLLVMWVFNISGLFQALIKARFQQLGCNGALFFLSFFISFVTFGLGLSLAIEGNDELFAPTVIHFLLIELFSICLGMTTYQLKYTMLRLFVITKELPYNALR